MLNVNHIRRDGALALVLLLAAACQAPTQKPGPGPMLEHDASFVVNGSHVTLQCIDCHDRRASSFQTAKVDCVRCHADASVTPRHGGIPAYVWSSPACIGCHRQGNTVPFDHTLFPTAAGTLHGGVGCAECHGTTRAVADLKCATCHGGQATLDTRHAGITGYGSGPAACYGCHRDGGVPAFDHRFPITAGQPHAPPITCADCHGATRAVADLKCITCHDQQAALASTHDGLPGYAYSSPTCYTCHADGRIPAVNHTQFPISAGATHEGITCRSCHGATRAQADLLCTSCHLGTHAQATMNAKHAEVPGYAWSSPACYDCHRSSQVTLPAGHDQNLFPVTGTAHAELTCGQCHGTSRAVAALRCTTCHGQVEMGSEHSQLPASARGRRDNVVRPNYEWSSPACVKCHADGQVHFIASHPRVPEGITGGDHRPFCLSCHPAMRATGKTWAADFGTSSCLFCHSSNNP